jgi:hypothetical protein
MLLPVRVTANNAGCRRVGGGGLLMPGHSALILVFRDDDVLVRNAHGLFVSFIHALTDGWGDCAAGNLDAVVALAKIPNHAHKSLLTCSSAGNVF